jgi:hypothetical protein
MRLQKMKKLIVWSLFLLVFTTLPAAAKEAVATVTSIQSIDDSKSVDESKDSKDLNAAKTLTIIRAGKTTVVSENDSLEAADIVDTANKTVWLKTPNGSTWNLENKTKFSVNSATKDGKPVYVFLEGSARYKAGEKAGVSIIKIKNKDYPISAGANVNFSRGAELDPMTSITITSGTLTIGQQEFINTGTSIAIDAQGNVKTNTYTNTDEIKQRGIRGHFDATGGGKGIPGQ